MAIGPSARAAYSGGRVGYTNVLQPSIYSIAERQNRRAAEDRAHEINMRELQYMAGLQALGLDQRGRPVDGGMNQFLGQWNQILQESRGVYNRALQDMEGGFQWMMDAGESARRLGGLAEELESEYRGFRQEFAGTEADFRMAAGEELQARGVARGELMTQLQADYEGAAGRAMADVTQQAEIARQSEARRLQRLGMDPTTMQGRAMMQRLGGQEATGRALAATQARRGERERVTGAAAMAMQLLDPTRMAQTAMSIRGAGTELLTSAAGLRQAETGALSGLAGQRADISRSMAAIGSGMARDIGAQYGDLAGLQMGLQYGQQQALGNIMGGSALQPSRGGYGGVGVGTNFGGPTSVSVAGSIGSPQYNALQQQRSNEFFSGHYQTTPVGAPVGMAPMPTMPGAPQFPAIGGRTVGMV